MRRGLSSATREEERNASATSSKDRDAASAANAANSAAPYAVPSSWVETVTAGGPSTCGTEVVVRVGVRENTVLLRDTNPETGAYEEMARWTPGSGDRPAPLAQAAKAVTGAPAP